jgi:hypothetical protein
MATAASEKIIQIRISEHLRGRLVRKISTLAIVLGLILGCRPGSQPRPTIDHWTRDAFELSTGYESLQYRRSREGEQARTYFYFIDERCRLVPGVVTFQPWRGLTIPDDIDEAARAEFEQLTVGEFEPIGDLDPRSWSIPSRGGMGAVPPGTWLIEARPTPVNRSASKGELVFAQMTATKEHDFVLVFHHAVPPRARNKAVYERRLGRRTSRTSRRCLVGPEIIPRFEIWLDEAKSVTHE